MQLIHTVFEPAGEGPFPTIIVFHGRGASAFDLLPLATYLAEGRFLVLCPQGPVEIPLDDARGFAWFSTPPGTPISEQDSEAAARMAADFVDSVAGRYPVDQRRLALLGFSQGGVMAYNLAIRQAHRFAALAALSTRFPPELAPRVSDSAGLQRLPMLIQHGRRDPVIPLERATQSAALLRSLNVPLEFQEYDCGHEITPQSLQALSRFLTDKVLG
jgi:phospholipase/carboxylesterase